MPEAGQKTKMTLAELEAWRGARMSWLQQWDPSVAELLLTFPGRFELILQASASPEWPSDRAPEEIGVVVNGLPAGRWIVSQCVEMPSLLPKNYQLLLTELVFDDQLVWASCLGTVVLNRLAHLSAIPGWTGLAVDGEPR